MQHERITITTVAAGTATIYSRALSGLLRGLYFELGTLDAGTDVTITVEETGAAVLTITNLAAAAWYAIAIPTYTTAGVAALYAAGGTAVNSPLPIDGRLKIVIAQGGNVTTGYVTAYVS